MTADLPKPLLPVAGQPLLRHLLDLLVAQGVSDLVLAAGFRSDAVSDFAAGLPSDWSVQVVDTGLETGTGGRVTRSLPELADRFLVTYGDGLGNVDLAGLVRRHEQHGRGATITTVPLPSQYGTLDLDDEDRVLGFQEKPVLRDHWINAGFIVLDKAVWQEHAADDLEREVLPSLAAAGRLAAYRHEGFWMSMDTLKDQQAMEVLALRQPPPWSVVHAVPGRP
jgi:glucose-1-phosphate cytidylyltransferase